MENKGHVLVEAVVDSLEAALAAQAAGADRLELCSGLELGGLTPGGGLVARVCLATHVPVHVLLRPRSGDFLYTADEYETLLDEVATVRALGAAGVVAGILLPNGGIDVVRMRRLVEVAAPLSVTFHRAFDRVADMEAALEAVVEAGCARLLSSGLSATAWEGRERLRWLQAHAGERLVVLPGGGITAANVAQLVEETGVREVHFSAIQQEKGGMTFQPAWGGGASQKVWVPVPGKVRAVKAALEMAR